MPCILLLIFDEGTINLIKFTFCSNIKRYNLSRKHLLLIALSFLFSNPIFAQDKEPKVALVLSGGGAKGVAHIAVLKKLDESFKF